MRRQETLWRLLRNACFLGNGRNTVSRVLFRRRELTEPHWVLRQTRWALRKTRWVRFDTQIIGREELAEFAPRNSVSPKKLTEFGVWNRALRNRIRPVSDFLKTRTWNRKTVRLIKSYGHRKTLYGFQHGNAVVFLVQKGPLRFLRPKNAWFFNRSWKATKEYLNQRGTKIRVFRVCFRTPFLPPFFPHFSPLFPLQALCILAPLLPSSPPPSSPLFWLPEKSDLGTL